jgi:hypothetical protein
MRDEHSKADAMAADRPIDTAAMMGLIALIGMIVFLLGT